MFKKVYYEDKALYLSEIFTDKVPNIVYASFVGDAATIKKVVSEAKSGVAELTGFPIIAARYTNNLDLTFDKKLKNSYEAKVYYEGDYGHLVIYMPNNGRTLLFNEDYSQYFEIQSNGGYLIRNQELPEKLTDTIFNAVKEISPVAVLDEWKEYLVDKVIRHFWVAICPRGYYLGGTANSNSIKTVVAAEFNGAEILNEIKSGLSSGAISIQNSCGCSRELLETKTIDQYISNFGQILCDKVTSNFNPLFDPAREELSQEIKDRTAIAAAHSHIFSYTAQENAEEAITRSMEVNKHTILSGACGSGKSGMAILSVDAHARKRNHKNYAALVMCPGTMPKEWMDTISGTIPFSDIFMVNDLGGMMELEKKIRDPKRKRPVYGVITYSTAKISYDERPSVTYHPISKKLVCPHCGEILMKKAKRSRYGVESFGDTYVKMTWVDFFEKNKFNDFCPKCNESLWQAATKDNSTGWVRLSKLGWIKESAVEDIKTYLDNIDRSGRDEGGFLQNSEKKKLKSYIKPLSMFQTLKKGTVQRFPRNYGVAKYVRKHMRKCFDYVICDEAHTVEGNSLQHQAFSDIIQSCWRSLSLTGTLSNGYASGLFNILFKTQTAKMLKDGFGYDDCREFVKKYGVEETTVESIVSPYSYTTDDEGNRIPNRYAHIRKISNKTKQIAGVSPLIFSKYLINNTIFLKQEDITKELVPYREIPVGVNMDVELGDRYEEIMQKIKEISLDKNSAGYGKRSAGIKNMITYMDMMLDQPYGLYDMVDIDGKVIIPAKELDSEKIRNKEQELIDICVRKKNAGEKMLIFVHWTGKLDIQNRLKKILRDNDIKARIMTEKIKMAERQDWINEKAEDADAIIVNPRLVDVGLNLLPYTTIIFYELGNQLSIIRQASKRSWRINQTHPVEVYYLYYKNTVQEQLLGAISQKLKAAAAIEGNFSAEGLSSIAADTDIMTMIAGSIVNDTSIEIEADSFENIGSVSAGEARKLRAESCVKLGLRDSFSYADINSFGKAKKATKHRKAKKTVQKIDYDVFSVLQAVV